MQITVNVVRENANDKTVFFTLVDDAGTEYKGSTDIPLSEEDEQSYCETNIERYMLFYLRKEYRKARFDVNEDQTELEAFRQWIEAGCVNTVQAGEDEEGNPIYEEVTIEKAPWEGTHPKWIKMEKDIGAATGIGDLKKLLKKIIKW